MKNEKDRGPLFLPLRILWRRKTGSGSSTGRGWKLVRMVPPCFYRFEKCQPEDVIPSGLQKTARKNRDYFQLYQDYGGEYLAAVWAGCNFRKAAAQENAPQDEELFSDNASRLDLIGHVIRTRLFAAVDLFLLLYCAEFGAEHG